MAWILILDEKPPIHENVLFAFEDHWNQVVGFRGGENEYWETSAHDNNSRIIGSGPMWWQHIEQVPHYREGILTPVFVQKAKRRKRA